MEHQLSGLICKLMKPFRRQAAERTALVGHNVDDMRTISSISDARVLRDAFAIQ